MQSTSKQRVVVLVDMDCFYCQVEVRLNPSLKGKPVAVVQYNQWKGGGIIAVNYEARGCGVTRGMRGDEAKEKCPDIVLVPVPSDRGKADLTNYRDAGEEVAKIFSLYTECVQRASIDEAYLDLTKEVSNFVKNQDGKLNVEELPNSFVVGHCDLKNKNEGEREKGLADWIRLAESEKVTDIANYYLAIGAIIVEKMRKQIFEETGFHCSAGIAHNKILAKLCAGLHKPNKQTILPHDNVPEVYETLPVYKIRNLGGKLGKQVSEKLSIKYMSELSKFSLQELQHKFDEKTSSWLYNIARGIDLEPVVPRLNPESIGCCKNFTGLNKLTKKSEVEHWLRELASEISDRLLKDLEKNKRRAKQLTISFYQESSMTRCIPLRSYNINKIVEEALGVLKKFNEAPSTSDIWKPGIKFLGLSACKFTAELENIQKFFKFSSSDQADQNTSKNLRAHENIKQLMSNENKKVDEKQNEIKNCATHSFFLNYLSKNKEKLPENTVEEELKESNGNMNPEEWVSLTDIIPDVNNAEPGIADILPDPLKKKFNERLSSGKNNSELNEKNRDKVANASENSEKCRECGENIPLDVFLEHLDYHVALRLSTEINGENADPRNFTVNGNYNKSNNTSTSSNEVLHKRKKNIAPVNSKKMKSITSFFNPQPK